MSEDLKSQVESLLFVSTKPVSVRHLARVLQVEEGLVQTEILGLQQEYQAHDRGVFIAEVQQAQGKKYQLISNPRHGELIKKYTKQEISAELTKPSLETLTIIAYRGPITKPELEKIRGVNCSMILRNLLIRDLIEEQKDLEKSLPAYNITTQFLQWLGVTSVLDLPQYEELNADEHLLELLQGGNSTEL